MKDMLYRLIQVIGNRVLLVFTGFLAAIIFLVVILYRTQITNYEYYTEQQKENVYSEYTVTAERGNIYDRYGRALAINVETRSLFFLPSENNEDLPGAIVSLLKILDENGETIDLTVEFPIGWEEGRGYFFKDDYTAANNPIGHNNFLAEVYYTSRDELTDEQKETDATTCMKILCEEQFGITLTEDHENDIRVASVRYAIFSGRFDTSVRVQIATNISEKTEVQIAERADEFRGFSADNVYTREYPQGELFAHIVGYVGRISESELAEKQKAGADYSEEDYIGKAGLEAVYEQQLRGTSGVVRKETDASTGNIISEVTMSPATKGDDIFLTIDIEVQEMTYQALVKQIKTLLIDKITGESGVQGSTYSAVDIYTALISNHFLPDAFFEVKSMDDLVYDQSGANDYLYAFQYCCINAREDSTAELYDLIYNTRYTYEEFQDWQKDLYDMLIGHMRDEIHLSYDYQEDEEFYTEYAAGKIAPYDFLVYCLENSYIDTSVYGITRNDSTDAKIRKILSYELDEVMKLEKFESFIYTYVLSTERFPQKSFLYLMYEQGLITDNDGTKEMLEWDEISEIDVLKMKIQEDEITPADINLDPCSGSVVVTDPDSGEVLAIASYPTYDPNLFMNDSTYYYEVIQDNSGPLSFRAVEETRAIGSTFKLATAIAGLDTGTITTTTEIYDDVFFPYANTDSDPSCWSAFSHGFINVVQALDYSCNYFFYQVGFLLSEPKPATADVPEFGENSSRDDKYYFDDDVGLEKLKYYTDLLGLSTLTGIELSESDPHASTLDAVRSAIGQGNGSYTCANLNRYTCTITNGGTVYDLFLIDEIHSADGEIVYTGKSEPDHESGISKQIINTVKQGMRLVVTDDHESDFAELESYGIHCAGKTGTAQEDETRPDHSLFTGYTNLENPEICVSVMIPFGGGSKNAIPVFVDIVAQYYGLSLDNDYQE